MIDKSRIPILVQSLSRTASNLFINKNNGWMNYYRSYTLVFHYLYGMRTLSLMTVCVTSISWVSPTFPDYPPLRSSALQPPNQDGDKSADWCKERSPEKKVAVLLDFFQMRGGACPIFLSTVHKLYILGQFGDGERWGDLCPNFLSHWRLKKVVQVVQIRGRGRGVR